MDCVRDITPTLREAFRVSQVDVPGPVFVELPVDILYPYSIIAEQFASMSTKKPKSIISKIVQMYTQHSLNHIFADAWKEREFDPLPLSVRQPKNNQIKTSVDLLKKAKRPLIIMGSQSILRPYGPDTIVEDIKKLGIPLYLNGAARGLMGSDYSLQFRHSRKNAIYEADVILLLGAICDFRLSYGRVFKRNSKIISVNRSLAASKLNARIFWQPTLAVESDIGKFVRDLTEALKNGQASKDGKVADISVDNEWLKTLRQRDDAKDLSIKKMAQETTETYLNPLKLLLKLQEVFKQDDTVLVADGGDFVASASYILKPCGPLRWLDPGPFGTLGCGAGFALAAKLSNPDKKVIAIMGDGAFGYAIPELDTFVRHKIPIYWIIGNDACWTQIAREQIPMLGSSIGCDLAHTDYHKVAEGFGAKGYQLKDDCDLNDKSILESARKDLENGTVVVNALIGKTKFREGSISV